MPLRNEKLPAMFFAFSADSAALPPAQNLTLDEAAIFLLERVEPRKRRRDRDPFGIARIDARHEWVYRVIEEFVAQAAAHKRGNRFLGAGGGGINERLAEQAQLRARARTPAS